MLADCAEQPHGPPGIATAALLPARRSRGAKRSPPPTARIASQPRFPGVVSSSPRQSRHHERKGLAHRQTVQVSLESKGRHDGRPFRIYHVFHRAQHRFLCGRFSDEPTRNTSARLKPISFSIRSSSVRRLRRCRRNSIKSSAAWNHDQKTIVIRAASGCLAGLRSHSYPVLINMTGTVLY